MKELQKKQQFKRRLYSTPSLVFLCLLVILVARGTYNVFLKRAESARYVTELQDQVAALKVKGDTLNTDLRALQTDAGIEKEVKEKYNVAKEGEKVVILVDTDVSTTTKETKESWWGKAWNAIMGN